MTRAYFVFAFIFIAAIANPACADDYTLGALKISSTWARATPKGAAVGGGYMMITNAGTTPDRLIEGSSDAAGRFEVHEMSMDNGVMRMRPVSGGLEIKPGQTVELKPGVLHVMFVGLNKPLQKGQRVKGTLVFEKAGKVEVEYPVVAIGAEPATAGGAMQHGTMDHGAMPHGH